MHIACSGVAQRVGFEPTCGFPQTDFEGRYPAKTPYISTQVRISW